MKVMALILLTLLTLSIGLSNGRTQKSSLMVTPNGWQSLPNVTNSTVIVASHGRRLIGFDEAGCADKHGRQDPDHRPNRSDTTAGRTGPPPPPARSNGTIGFDRIPVIDLNGTAYLLSDNIVPVSTLSGDIIYTTPQALISIPNNTTNTTTATNTSTKTPLERYRLRQDSPRKNLTSSNGTLLNGADEKPRSGSNHSNSMTKKKGIYSLPPSNRSSTTNTTSNLTSPTSAGRPPSSSTSTSSAKLPSSSLPNGPRMMSPDMTTSIHPEDHRFMFPDITSSAARLRSSNPVEDPQPISSDMNHMIPSTGNHLSEDPRMMSPDMTARNRPVDGQMMFPDIISTSTLLSSILAEDPQLRSSDRIPSTGPIVSEDPRIMFPDTTSSSRLPSRNMAEDPQLRSSDRIPSTGPIVSEDPRMIFPDMISSSNDGEDEAGIQPTDLTSSVILISSNDIPQDPQLISSSDIAPSALILISSDIPLDPLMIPSDSMTTLMMSPQQSSQVAGESRSMYPKDPSSSSAGKWQQSSNDGNPGRPMFSESAPCACNNQK